MGLANPSGGEGRRGREGGGGKEGEGRREREGDEWENMMWMKENDVDP